MSQCRRWMFTIFGDTYEELLTILQSFDSPKWGAFGAAQVECCPTTNRLHIQGFLQFDSPKRFAFVKKLHATAHWEASKGNFEDAFAYCTKEDTRVPGSLPRTWGSHPLGQGKRTDLDDAVATLMETKSNVSHRLRQVAQLHPGVYVKFHKGLEALARATVDQPPVLDVQEWRSWQRELITKLSSTPDDRTIYWYTDRTGGAGKSTLVRWYLSRPDGDAVALEGKIADMAYTYDNERIVFFDLSRTQLEYMDHLFSFAEKLKNGFLHSTKYSSVMKRFKPPHVVFFANDVPKEGVWSSDRLVHVELDSQVFNAATVSSQVLTPPRRRIAPIPTAPLVVEENPFACIEIPSLTWNLDYRA